MISSLLEAIMLEVNKYKIKQTDENQLQQITHFDYQSTSDEYTYFK